MTVLAVPAAVGGSLRQRLIDDMTLRRFNQPRTLPDVLSADEVGRLLEATVYRRDEAGRPRIMTLSATEFIRRFRLHVLPRGFHRIRHYGLLTGSNRKAGLDHIRAILGVPSPPRPTADAPGPPDGPGQARPPCPCCGGPMTIVGAFARWHRPRGPPFRSPPNRAWTP